MRSRRARGRLSGVDINPEALRKARVAAGLSLAQAGGEELTRQAVHLIETGKVRPSMRSLRVLAQRVQVPVATLLTAPDGIEPNHEDSIAELDQLCRQQEFEEVLVRARELLDSARSPEVIAGAHRSIGCALCYFARPEEALRHLHQARALYEAMDDDQGQVAETLELEALALQVAEDPRALEVAEAALHRYRALDGRRPEVESRLLQRLGTILLGRLDFRAAKLRYEQALELSGGVRDLIRLARLYHGLGMCHEGLGDVRLGLDLLLKAHTLYEAEERLAPSGGKSDLGRIENDIGMMVLRRGDTARAEEHLMSSLRRFERAGMERLRSHVFLTLGELRQRQGRIAEAIEFVSQAVAFAERFEETRALTVAHRQLGELYASRGDRDLAASSFQRALRIARAAGLESLHSECLVARDRALGGLSAATGTSA